VQRTFDPSRVRFVLVEPLYAGNVGAAARALKNLGFGRLVLVRPRCEATGREARSMAVEAQDVLARAEIHDEIDRALAGAQGVVGTSRRTGKHRRPHYRLDHFAPELLQLAMAGELAVVFGREDRGLTDAEVDRCTHLVHLPASPEYGSLNLAQALLLVAYELRRAVADQTGPAELRDPPAAHEDREAMYHHLEQALRAIGFLKGDAIEPMMRRLRRLIGRAAPTSSEVQILRGIARQALWAARQAGASDHGDEERC
jgi:TrmH family RNA methyltransferase